MPKDWYSQEDHAAGQRDRRKLLIEGWIVAIIMTGGSISALYMLLS